MIKIDVVAASVYVKGRRKAAFLLICKIKDS